MLAYFKKTYRSTLFTAHSQYKKWTKKRTKHETIHAKNLERSKIIWKSSTGTRTQHL